MYSVCNQSNFLDLCSVYIISMRAVLHVYTVCTSCTQFQHRHRKAIVKEISAATGLASSQAFLPHAHLCLHGGGKVLCCTLMKVLVYRKCHCSHKSTLCVCVRACVCVRVCVCADRHHHYVTFSPDGPITRYGWLSCSNTAAALQAPLVQWL